MPIIVQHGGGSELAGALGGLAMGGAVGRGLQEIRLQEDANRRAEDENRRAEERLALAAEEMRRQQARADAKFRQERAHAAFRLGQLQRDNEAQEAVRQDAQLRAEALKNRILRGLPPGVAGPSEALGGGVPTLLARPGAAGGGAVRPPDLLRGGGAYGPTPAAAPELTPAQALSGRDMSTAPSLFGGVVGNQIPNVMTDYDLQILDGLQTPEAIQGFIADIQARQDAAVEAWDRSRLSMRIENIRAYARGSVDDEVLGGELDGLLAQLNATPDRKAFGVVANTALKKLGEIEGKVETEFMRDAWMSYYTRSREELMNPESDLDFELRNKLLESLKGSHRAVMDDGADPRDHMLNPTQRERQMLMEGVAESNAALAQARGQLSDIADAATPPRPISEVPEEELLALRPAAVEAFRQAGADGVVALMERAGIAAPKDAEFARILESIQALSEAQAEAEKPKLTEEQESVEARVKEVREAARRAAEFTGVSAVGRGAKLTVSDAEGVIEDVAHVLGKGSPKEQRSVLHSFFRLTDTLKETWEAKKLGQLWDHLKDELRFGHTPAEAVRYIEAVRAGAIEPEGPNPLAEMPDWLIEIAKKQSEGKLTRKQAKDEAMRRVNDSP